MFGSASPDPGPGKEDQDILREKAREGVRVEREE